ncbi:MAG: hypothetical protein HN732_00150 [Rhodospirillaceae bacterium]|nr:hypothetical protein [Rhodospirillaceae bacterium]
MDTSQEIASLEVAIMSGEWQQAEASLRSLGSRAGDDMKFVYLKTMVDKQFDRKDEAASGLRQLISVMPEFGHLYGELAEILSSRGGLEEAAELLQKATALEPDKAEHWLALASVSVALGERAAALAAFQSARRLMPENGSVRSAVQTLKMQPSANPPIAQRVVLVSDRPGVREAKISSALRTRGWQVMLLHKAPVSSGFVPYFDQVQPFDDVWQAVRDAAAFDAAVTHVFCYMNYVTASAFVATGLNKVILDFYDNVDGMLSEEFFEAQSFRRLDASSERALAFKADGLVCRNLESQVLKANGGGRQLPKRLFYPDYAWGEGGSRQEKSSDRDGEMHLVAAGTVWLEKEADVGFLWLAEILEEFRVHLHVYASNIPDDDFEEKMVDYLNFEARSNYLHIHKPVRDHFKLLQTLSAYDATILIRRSLVTGGSPWQYSENKYRYSYTNKVADSVDAGLSMIIHPESNLNYGLGRRLGVVIPATPDLMNREYWVNAFAQVKHHQRADREGQAFYAGREQCHRLIEFYQAVAGN